MSPTLVTFIGFVVAVLIILWAVIEMGKRITRHSMRKRFDTQSLNTWVTLKPPTPEPSSSALDEEDAEGTPDIDLQLRSKQNGHYSPSKKPQ